MTDQNTNLLAKKGREYNFLLDSSTIIYFEKMHGQCGVSIFTAFQELPDVEFFVCNDVLSELISGTKGFNPIQLRIFVGHIINAESSMMHGWKENRFLVQENGETKYVVLNKISSADYAQILLCQNHPELVLVANDRKMLKSAIQVLGNRAIGIPALLNQLLQHYPSNKRLQMLKKTGNEMFLQKHAFN